jgi:hypothetical protein
MKLTLCNVDVIPNDIYIAAYIFYK